MSKDAQPLPDDPSQLKVILLAERQEHAQANAQHATIVTRHEAVLAQYEDTITSQQRTIAAMEYRLEQLIVVSMTPSKNASTRTS
jgi:hypothetical protein